MYSRFFGFTEKPFDVTPDPKFLYLSPTHREMLAALVHGIRDRRGFITIVGEVGTGKTTLLNAVLDRIDEQTKVAYIFNTDLSFEQMLTMVLQELGLAMPQETLLKVEKHRRLNDYAIKQLARGGNVVLIVDEAQNLDTHAMENLRLLSNLETRKHKLIQIVLSGQPELDFKLSRPELRQFAQRISVRRYINPLSEEETYEYIQHRLATADYKGPALFNRKAQKMIWQYSGGVPRKINILCDNAFLIAFALKKRKINEDMLKEAITDLTWSPFSAPNEPEVSTLAKQYVPKSQKRLVRPRFALATGLFFVVCLIYAVWLFLGDASLNRQVERSLLPKNNEVRFKVMGQPSEPEKSPDRTLTRVPAESSSSGNIALASITRETPPPFTSPDAEQIQEQEKPGLDPTEAEEGEPSVRLAPALIEKEDSASRPLRVVVVKGGDTLYEIIKQAFGTYDETILDAVMHENPQIVSPDRIFVGQEIKLPNISL